MAVKGPVIMINLFQIMQISMKRNNLLGKKINDAGNTSKKKKEKKRLANFLYIHKKKCRWEVLANLVLRWSSEGTYIIL